MLVKLECRSYYKNNTMISSQDNITFLTYLWLYEFINRNDQQQTRVTYTILQSLKVQFMFTLWNFYLVMLS